MAFTLHRTPPCPGRASSSPLKLVASARGDTLLSQWPDGTLLLHTPRRGRSRALPPLEGAPRHVGGRAAHPWAVSPGGRLVAGQVDGRVHVWDGRDGRCRHRAALSHDGVTHVAFQPDATAILSAHSGYTGPLADLFRWPLRDDLMTTPARVSHVGDWTAELALAQAPNGDLYTAHSGSHMLVVSRLGPGDDDIDTLTTIARALPSTEGIARVALDVPRRRLIGVTLDRRVGTLTFRGHSRLGELTLEQLPSALALSPDGEQLLVWSQAMDTVDIWDWQRAERLGSLQVSAGALARACLGPWGAALARDDGQIECHVFLSR